MNKQKITTVASTITALALTGSAAGAALPRTLQYGNPGEEKPPPTVVGGTGGGGSPTVPEAVSGALPFTGLQAALVLIGGAGIAATGFGLRRLGRSG